MAGVLQEEGDADSSACTRHFSDCLICTRDSVSIIFLLRMMEGWDRWGVVASYQDLGGVDRGWVLSLSLFFRFVFIWDFVFWSLMSCLLTLTRSYWGIEIVVSVM